MDFGAMGAPDLDSRPRSPVPHGMGLDFVIDEVARER
jgi:hypothetical protein